MIFKVLKNKQLEPTVSVKLFSKLVYRMNPPPVILQSTQLELPILQSTEAEGKRKAFLALHSSTTAVSAALRRNWSMAQTLEPEEKGRSLFLLQKGNIGVKGGA